MREIGAFEAKNTLGTLLDCVERGEEIVITRHGKPVARLIASAGSVDRTRAKAASDRIRARAGLLTPAPFDWDSAKADRDEGRP
jgi:prevent-host-death family protein